MLLDRIRAMELEGSERNGLKRGRLIKDRGMMYMSRRVDVERGQLIPQALSITDIVHK